jgi:hypothetical protein
VHDEHPLGAEVHALLASTRERTQALWDRVSAYNQQHPPDESRAERVVFYAGQYEVAGADDDASLAKEDVDD